MPRGPARLPASCLALALLAAAPLRAAAAPRALREALPAAPPPAEEGGDEDGASRAAAAASGGNESGAPASVAGSLKLASALARAVALMEEGTERLLGSPGASQEAAGPLRQILHELQGMHQIAAKLRGQTMSDMVSLQAEADRQRSAAEAARRESSMLGKDEGRVQQEVRDAEEQKCRGELQRKTWSFMMEMRAVRHNLTRECALSRRRDSQQLENLTEQERSCEGDMDRLAFEAERAKADLRDREEAVADLQKRLHDLEDERNLLVLERQSLQQNVSATRKQWEQDKQFETQVTAEWKSKTEDLQEELGDRLEQARGLLTTNADLKKDIEVQKQTIASLQRSLAAMTEDKAALLDSMRAFIHGNGMPAARMVRAAANGSLDAELSLRRTEKIDTYLTRVHSTTTTTSTLPRVEASALTKVFGARAPEIVRVLGPPGPTPKPKEALQRFLDIDKVPEGSPAPEVPGEPPRPAAGAAPPSHGPNASAGRPAAAKMAAVKAAAATAAASATSAAGATAADATAAGGGAHRTRGARRRARARGGGSGGGAAAAGLGGHAAEERAAIAAAPAAASASRRQAAADARSDAASVERAEAAVSSQLAAAGGRPGAEDGRRSAEQEARLLRESFGEADRALGGAEPRQQEADPVVPPLRVTDASVAAAGAAAMQDLFSEADRVISSAVEG